LAIEIANAPVTGGALVWRGGTCLHQLHLKKPARYSEDLDYVLLAKAADYRQLDAAFAAIAAKLDVEIEHTERKPTRYRTFMTAKVAGFGSIKAKVEINTGDADPLLELIRPEMAVDVRAWYQGSAEVPTYQPAELVGTKFRALAQRDKGRDLWDLDFARSALAIPDGQLAAAAVHYLRHANVSPAEFRQRLAHHLTAPSFLSDPGALLVGGAAGYDPIRAGRRVIVWSDANLDPLMPTHEQRQSRQRTPSGLLRCPVYASRSGALVRCGSEVAPGGVCPDHPGEPPVQSW